MKSATLQRLLLFCAFGVVSEAARLLAFRYLQDSSVILANFASVPFGVAVAFILYSAFVWPDRPGALGGKITRFVICKIATALVKWLLFPGWLAAFPCPFYNLTYTILDELAPGVAFLGELISCEWMSVATMDLTIALTLSFYLHNTISFAGERMLQLNQRHQLKRIIGDFGMASMVACSFLGIYLAGIWGVGIGSIGGFIAGAIAGAFYIAVARPGLCGG